jgi:hypothetical protein
MLTTIQIDDFNLANRKPWFNIAFMLAAIIDQGNPDRIKNSGISYQLRHIDTLYAGATGILLHTIVCSYPFMLHAYRRSNMRHLKVFRVNCPCVKPTVSQLVRHN